ncbi:MAG TPA: DUF1376 domain-containing protein [Lysobacter sp.]
MNYFELYPGDYLRDTTRLSLIEHGAYLRLLMAYYAEEQPLPGDVSELFQIVGAISSADKAALKKVAERFFPVGEDGLRRNGRADEEIEKAQKRIATARANGSKGGRKANPAGNPTGSPAQNPPGSPTGNPLDPLEGTQRVTQSDTQRGTHSGEALHTPHAITTPERVERTEKPQGARSSAADHAIALNRIGIRVTASDPRLLEAVAEGITVEHLTELAQAHPGKGAPYLIATARGQLRDGAPGDLHAPRQSVGRLSAVERVQANVHRARQDRGELHDFGSFIDGTAVRVAN